MGVVVLLCLMVFRNADLGIHTGQSTMLLALFFVIMTVCPHLANQLSPVLGMLLNIAALAVLILFGCHNPFMFNQSTLVLGYLLLYGYDVTGKSYQMRLTGMALGAALTCFIFYRNHKNRTYKRNLNDLVQEFDIIFFQNKVAVMSDHMRTGSTLHCGTLQYATGNVGWNCGNVSNLTIYGGHAIQSPQKDCRKYCRCNMFYSTIFSASVIHLYIHRNPWRNWCRTFCKIWLAGSI